LRCSLPRMTDPAGGRAAAFRYDFGAVDLDSDSVHAKVVTLVDRGSHVLELGTATGHTSQALADRDCTVVGIEIDEDMAAEASGPCERMIVGDLDALDLTAELGDEEFDAIVAADVLEHLKDPLGVLNRVRSFLKPDGCVVISVPNVAHGSVRLALLSGHFDYQKTGLLDSTHLRFFTRRSLEELLDEAELGLAEMHRHELDFDASEVGFDLPDSAVQLPEELGRDRDARTYQFVVKAFPMVREGLREVQLRLREVAELRAAAARVPDLEKTVDEIDGLRLAAGRTAELEKVLAEIGDREGELRSALIDAHDQLLRRDAEIERLTSDVKKVHSEAERRDSEITQAHAEARQLREHLNYIQASAPFRAYAAVRRIPVVRAVLRRRNAAASKRG
jgi:2-polyprenyl-3-methyl-5-hydroxy-6-metoxy-1,4-benzoquinol methylase